MRVTCPDCKGTGICTHKNAVFPHSCCGDCKRIEVLVSAVPKGFTDKVPPPQTVLIGCGYLEVSVWRWLLMKISQPFAQ